MSLFSFNYLHWITYMNSPVIIFVNVVWFACDIMIY